MAISEILKGILLREGKKSYILGDRGTRLIENYPIWEGYLLHWMGKPVYAKFLPQRDYVTGKPIMLIWPQEPESKEPFFELYYNEQLIKYPASTCGHIAININGEIFNYSHLLNENEIITYAEYFYRPACGEFAPDPETAHFNVSNPLQPYFDKFGRSFMRTIHVARIEGADTNTLALVHHQEMQKIHDTPKNPKKPHKYSQFNIITRNCSSIIRDSLRKVGFPGVRGIFPRDMFISAIASFIAEERRGKARLTLYTKPQLKVPEAPYSKLSPLTNPLNYIQMLRLHKLKRL